MILHLYRHGRSDVGCFLTGNTSSEVYAKFFVRVRNNSIKSYEFVNEKLLPSTFSEVSRLVASYSLLSLLRNVGKTIEISLDGFEWK